MPTPLHSAKRVRRPNSAYAVVLLRRQHAQPRHVTQPFDASPALHSARLLQVAAYVLARMLRACQACYASCARYASCSRAMRLPARLPVLERHSRLRHAGFAIAAFRFRHYAASPPDAAA